MKKNNLVSNFTNRGGSRGSILKPLELYYVKTFPWFSIRSEHLFRFSSNYTHKLDHNSKDFSINN